MRIISIICLLLIVVSANSKKPLIGILVDISVHEYQHGDFGIIEELAIALEENGATPQMIFYDEQHIALMNDLNSMNGFIFQPSILIAENSNQEEIGKYLQTANEIYNYAKQYYLPLLGIVEGLEVIYEIEGGNIQDGILDYLDSYQQNLFFIPEQILDYGYLQEGQVVDFLTHRGLSEDSFLSNSNLKDNFQITSISVREDSEMDQVHWTVSSFQSNIFPIMAVQFEPYNPSNIPYGAWNSFISVFTSFAIFYMENPQIQ